MRKSENQRRLDAHLNLSKLGVSSRVGFDVRETFFSLAKCHPSEIEPSVIEITIESSFVLKVFADKDIALLGKTKERNRAFAPREYYADKEMNAWVNVYPHKDAFSYIFERPMADLDKFLGSPERIAELFPLGCDQSDLVNYAQSQLDAIK